MIAYFLKVHDIQKMKVYNNQKILSEFNIVETATVKYAKIFSINIDKNR